MCRNNLGKYQIIDGLILNFANKKTAFRTLSAGALTRSAGGPPALRT